MECGPAPSPRLTACSVYPDGPPESPTSAVDPTPSCPRPFHPQHTTLPSARRAQVWDQPVAMAVARCPGRAAGGRERGEQIESASKRAESERMGWTRTRQRNRRRLTPDLHLIYT
jgi:hypothetical protein